MDTSPQQPAPNQPQEQPLTPTPEVATQADPAPAEPATPTESATPVESPATTPALEAAAPVAALPKPRKGLAITALVLSIIALLLGLAWPISALFGLVAIILAIVSLAKKRSGKGVAVAALIVGGVALLLVPFWAAVSAEVYNNISEKVNETSQSTTNE